MFSENKDNVGLYRDDGLILVPSTSGKFADKSRKELHAIFNQTVNFLDITLNL